MKRLVGFSFVILLSACAVPVSTERSVIVPYDDAPQVTASQPRPTGKRGVEAAAELARWYNDKVTDCGNPGLAAALCSGVMLRATENNPAFLPWDPSNASIISGGVSFSWLRADSNFSNLVFGYRNGFIFYPVLRTRLERTAISRCFASSHMTQTPIPGLRCKVAGPTPPIPTTPVPARIRASIRQRSGWRNTTAVPIRTISSVAGVCARASAIRQRDSWRRSALAALCQTNNGSRRTSCASHVGNGNGRNPADPILLLRRWEP